MFKKEIVEKTEQKNQPLISIIVPIYNAEKYLERCIKSIIGQTYINIEILLINDGSKDNSGKICENFANEDSRIIVIHKENTGVSDTRNVGIDKSKGEYIAFVDSDDTLSTRGIETLYNKIQETGYSIVRGQAFRRYKNKDIDNKKFEKIDYSFINNLNNMEFARMSVQGDFSCYVWLLLIESSIIKNRIYFDSYMQLWEDIAFYIDLFLCENKIYFFEDITYYYYINKESAVTNKEDLIKWVDAMKSLSKHVKDSMQRLNIKDKTILQQLEKKMVITIYSVFRQVFDYNKKEINEIYIKLQKDSEVLGAFKNTNLKELNLLARMPLTFFIADKYNFFIISLKISKSLRIIKNMFKKENKKIN